MLADPTRRRILDLLAERGELTVGQLAAEFPDLVTSGISKHLMGLRSAHLVTATKVGRTQRYRLDAATFAAALSPWLAHYEPHFDDALNRLRRFVESGAKPPQASEAPPHHKESHVRVTNPQAILFVADCERAARFYQVFGFHETFRTPGTSPVKIELRLDGFTLGLALTAPAAENHHITPVTHGHRACISLWTDDIDHAYRTALGAGAKNRQEPHPTLDGQLLVAFVEDADEHPIQLVQVVDGVAGRSNLGGASGSSDPAA